MSNRRSVAFIKGGEKTQQVDIRRKLEAHVDELRPDMKAVVHYIDLSRYVHEVRSSAHCAMAPRLGSALFTTPPRSYVRSQVHREHRRRPVSSPGPFLRPSAGADT